jgi:hypothetical protein
MESMEKEFLDLVEKKMAEQKAIVDKKLMNIKFWYHIIELVVSILGYGLIIYNFNIWLALGVWLAIWGNNMGMIRNIHNTRGNFWREIWKDRN